MRIAVSQLFRGLVILYFPYTSIVTTLVSLSLYRQPYPGLYIL